MGDNAKQETLTFESEEAQRAALIELSEADVPSGVDPDEWQAEIDQKQERILAAQITGNEDPAPAPKADEQDPPQADPAPGAQKPPEPTDNDDEELTFSIKRSELPEILRSYKTPQQMLEQAAHARRYANTKEQEFAQLAQEKQQLSQQVQLLSERAKEVETLKQRMDELQKSQPSTRSTDAQSRAVQDQVDELAKAMEGLQELEDDDTVDAATLKKTLAAANAQFGAVSSGIQSLQQAMRQAREEQEKRLSEVSGKFETWQQQEENRKRQEEERRKQQSAMQALLDFQKNKPELQTTKPPFGSSGDTVENAVMRFTDRVHGQPLYGNWQARNVILNGYLTEHPDVVKHMQANGISLADYGINDQDLRNWALLQRVYWRSRGEDINPTTGERVPKLNLWGKPVAPSGYAEAYNNLLDDLGLRDKMHQQEVAEAEKRGQESLRNALSQRDTGILGKDGSSSPAGASKPMEQGEAIAFIDSANQSDFHEDMQRKILSNDPDGWAMFDRFNAALQSIGYPVQPPDPAWPPRESVRQT